MAVAENRYARTRKHGEKPRFCSVPARQAEIGKALAWRELERRSGADNAAD